MQEQFCACGGVLSAPITASSVASEYVPSALEQQTAEEIRDLLHKAQVIMQDPAKVKLLSQRIQQVRQEIGPMRILRSKRVLLALNVLRALIRSNYVGKTERKADDLEMHSRGGVGVQGSGVQGKDEGADGGAA